MASPARKSSYYRWWGSPIHPATVGDEPRSERTATAADYGGLSHNFRGALVMARATELLGRKNGTALFVDAVTTGDDVS